jgi:hypothetical protein
MSKIAFLMGLCAALLGSTALADDWVRPAPTSFHARGFGFVAEIFPPMSRQNPGDKPLCYFYALGYPGSDWSVDARLLWKTPLINDRMPYQALVSQQGELVTLNEHGRVGYENAVVIYDKQGHLVRDYGLDELLPGPEASLNENTNKITISTSSRWWNKEATYYFLGEPSRFYVVLPWGTALEFFLDSGKVTYGPAAGFPALTAPRANQFANEQVEVWPTSLRFSSITDVLAAKAGSK